MHKLSILAVMCLVMVLLACKKDSYVFDPNFVPPTAALSSKGYITSLTGKWEWIKGISSTAVISNPAISNYTEGLDFGTDSILTIYRNNNYYYQFKFKYVADYKFSGRVFNMTIIGDSKYETEIKSDTLTLSTFEYGNRDQRIYTKLKQ